MASQKRKSKRRSAASSKAEPPDPVVLFIDRSLGGRTVADALRLAGATVEVHDDHFPQDAPDDHWLTEAGRRGWAVLTKDKAVRRRLIEREAILAAGVRAFFLTSGNLRGEEMAEIFVRHLKRIESLIRSRSAPFIAHVTRTSVQVAEPRRRLKRGR